MNKPVGKVILLTLVVLLCALPMFAQAETSGTCGENLTWVLDDEGTLTISGTGKMKEYGTYNQSPWGREVNTVIINSGVTSIGGFAFEKCSSLTSISIPDSVTSIGSAAFQLCGSLSSINIPEGLTSIGSSAFHACSSLTSLSIPESVTSIGDSAFSGCSGLASISIPDGVTRIGYYTFSGCSSLSGIKIPDGVTSIGFGAFFGCSNLTSVNIPDGVTIIESSTFSGCSSLTSMNIPAGVTSIEWQAFRDCSSLTSINIPEGVTSIESETFRGCSSLSRITLPASLTEMGDSAFQSCTSLTSINIPAGVTSIKDAAFRECSSLTSISIPDGVTSIGWTAFYNCSSLSNINIPAGVTEIGSYAFCGCSSLTSLHIPSGVTSLKHAVFSGCSSLSSISLPAGVTAIGDFAFAGCSSLPSISLPASVSSIGENAFQNCSSLTGISIPAGVTSIGRDTFRFCRSLSSVNIPNSVTSIDIFAFDGCSALESIYIPDSVVSIHNRAFETSKSSVTIYCNEYSYAETWAQQTDHNYILLDAEQVEIFLPEAFTMPVGSTRPMDCTIMPSDPDLSTIWSSSDSSVATVDEAGIVTALRSGTTTITVKAKNTSASCKLTVVEPATALSLPETIYIVAKSKQQVPVSISPSHAVTQLTYKTEDSNYLSISKDGLMTAGAVGTTQLTVMDSLTGLTAKANVRITYPVTDVAFAQDSMKALSGQNAQLTVSVTMRSDSCVNQLVTFKSSNTSVATVDQNGLVRAVGAGTAAITATADSGVSATCSITVVSREACPPGDADLDGVTTMDDAMAILHYVADGSGEDFGTMDMDGNGTVDIYDAFMILQQEAGW